MIWNVWLDWALEHQGRLLYLVFLLLGASYIAYAPIGAYRLLWLGRSSKFHLLSLFGAFLMAYAFRGLCGLIANIDPPQGPINYTRWWAWWHWTGEAGMWITSLALCIYLFWLRHKDSDDSG